MAESEDLRAVLRDNVCALLGTKPKERGVTAAIMRAGIGGTDATRILKANTDFGISKLAAFAEALKIEPWQLFVPGLDPDRRPTLEPASFRWPFRQIDPEVVTGLVGTTAMNVENGILVALAAAGVAPRRQAKMPPAAPASVLERVLAMPPKPAGPTPKLPPVPQPSPPAAAPQPPSGRRAAVPRKGAAVGR